MANEYHYLELDGKIIRAGVISDSDLSTMFHFTNISNERKTASLLEPFSFAQEENTTLSLAGADRVFNAVRVLQTCIVYGTHNLGGTGHIAVTKNNDNEAPAIASTLNKKGVFLGIQYFDAASYVKNLYYGRLCKAGEVIYCGNDHSSAGGSAAANLQNVKMFAYAPTIGTLKKVQSNQFNWVKAGDTSAIPTPSNPQANNTNGNPDPSTFLDFTPTNKFIGDSATLPANDHYTVNQSITEGMSIVAASDKDIVIFISHSFRPYGSSNSGISRNFEGDKAPATYITPSEVIGFNTANSGWYANISTAHIPKKNESIGFHMDSVGLDTRGCYEVQTNIHSFEL